MRIITTTIRPDEEIEVGEDEYLDLSRQGLVKSEKASPETKKETKNA